MRELFEEAFRIGLPVIMVAGLAYVLGGLFLEDRRQRRVQRARMLAVTGPLVDDESPTDPKGRVRVWERKTAGTWPVLRLPAGWNRRA